MPHHTKEKKARKRRGRGRGKGEGGQLTWRGGKAGEGRKGREGRKGKRGRGFNVKCVYTCNRVILYIFLESLPPYPLGELGGWNLQG